MDHSLVLKNGSTNNLVLNIIVKYFEEFASYENLNEMDISNRYNNFLIEYSKDLENFLETGLYPYEFGNKRRIGRVDYDIALILSVLTTLHRYRIIDNIYKKIENINGKILVVGIGSGLELELLRSFGLKKNVDAYDIIISDFVKNRFQNIFNLYEEKFTGIDNHYNYIFAIELLEHLENPSQLLSTFYDALKLKGSVLMTTATNLPQFDHLYNFDNKFDEELEKFGFSIFEREDIHHVSIKINNSAKNTWYHLKKF